VLAYFNMLFQFYTQMYSVLYCLYKDLLFKIISTLMLVLEDKQQMAACSRLCPGHEMCPRRQTAACSRHCEDVQTI